MDLDAGHGRIERRGLDVEQPDGRGADQHQLAGDPIGGDAALDHVLGRHVAGRVVRREMDPELAVAVGRNFEPGHRDAFDAGGVGADQDGAGSGRPRAASRGSAPARRCPAGLHDHRARGARCRRARCGCVRRPRPAAACSSTGMLRSRPGNVNRNGFGSRPERRDPGRRRLSDRRHVVGRMPDWPRTTRDCLIASASTSSLLGRLRSFALRLLVEVAEAIGGDARATCRSGFGEHHVEGDGDRAEAGQPLDQVGDQRARPRPLPERAQAVLVDIDDDHRLDGRRRAA